MSVPIPAEPDRLHGSWDLDVAELGRDLQRLGAQLVQGGGANAPGVAEALAELERLRRQLQTVLHIATIEQEGFADDLAEIDRRLASGWDPLLEARPSEAAVAELRALQRRLAT